MDIIEISVSFVCDMVLLRLFVLKFSFENDLSAETNVIRTVRIIRRAITIVMFGNGSFNFFSMNMG